MKLVYLIIALAPLLAAIVAGLFGRRIGRTGAHSVTIGAVGLSFVLSLVAFWHIAINGAPAFNESVYTWLVSDGIRFEIGFLIDNLTVLMMTVVTFVSLMVHVYTIGYMHDDPGYQRFFSYISLFTFAMLMLVMSNNFLQLFFGWEAVGLVSYLLIGFWYTRESAIRANLKAFLVNRVGDFGFVLGIAAIVAHTGSLDYTAVFKHAQALAGETIAVLPSTEWSLMTVICILLFIGAMGKSAQMPLHVWLPDSMEGPTPISALIHAATMVTAGIFMVARMSPLFELSETALTLVMVIGALTAFFMGLVGLVQHDIKRVVAYSTLSQLGYMTVALGASAYAAGIFHLLTHAFFKSLLFLAAGSVIVALHHEQDMRRMGGLKKYMPVTYWTALAGSLALIGFPGFSGFFSKDAIIEAVHASHLPGAGLAYWLVLVAVFVTAVYTFRMFFLVFHGPERIDPHAKAHLHESPKVITVPLVLLAIPSVIAGYVIGPVLFGGFFGDAIVVMPAHDTLAELAQHHEGVVGNMLRGLAGAPFWLAIAGLATAWWLYIQRPDLPAVIERRFSWASGILRRKYGFDEFNEHVIAGGGRGLAQVLWRGGDVGIIDGVMVNGTARMVGWFSGRARLVQTGYLYHYAFVMIIGLLLLLSGFVFV
ncbi:MAG: NADH-quinone oxidoreductase subunit L [Gammaproteobacteria bacterium]|nr:NADH-quinone oxidoreductase subunit L [Gammaproteobacteria bacterium]